MRPCLGPLWFLGFTACAPPVSQLVQEERLYAACTQLSTVIPGSLQQQAERRAVLEAVLTNTRGEVTLLPLSSDEYAMQVGPVPEGYGERLWAVGWTAAITRSPGDTLLQLELGPDPAGWRLARGDRSAELVPGGWRRGLLVLEHEERGGALPALRVVFYFRPREGRQRCQNLHPGAAIPIQLRNDATVRVPLPPERWDMVRPARHPLP